jgi:hypothetical protein
VIEGLLSGLERKTAEPIARPHGVPRKPTQFFVGAGKWDDEGVMGNCAGRWWRAWGTRPRPWCWIRARFPRRASIPAGWRAPIGTQQLASSCRR